MHDGCGIVNENSAPSVVVFVWYGIKSEGKKLPSVLGETQSIRRFIHSGTFEVSFEAEVCWVDGGGVGSPSLKKKFNDKGGGRKIITSA